MRIGLIILFLLSFNIFAQEIPPVIPNTFVQDFTGLLNESDKNEIQNNLNQFKSKYDLEFGVALVETTQPYSIEDYALKMARTYGIGSKDNEKRGMLLLLAIKDRKWRFEISRHMEGILTDGQSGSIGRNSLVPKLKIASQNSTSQNWKDAIITTLNATDKQIEKNNTPQQLSSSPSSSSATGILGFLLGIIALLGSVFGVSAIFIRRKEKKEEDNRRRLTEERIAERARLIRERELWLKTPEGIAYTEKQAREAANRRKEEMRRQEEYDKWAKSPQGRAELAEKKRQEDLAIEARRKRQRQSSSSSSYGSSDSSSSYSSPSSSYDSSPSSSFGGGSDYGGGGSSGSW